MSGAAARRLDYGVQTIGPQEAQALIASGGLDIVDVRDPNEWSTGHLPGARLVPLPDLRQSLRGQSLRDSFPQDGVMFVCAAGVRSETAARLALESGLSTVYNLHGGTRGWVRAGLLLIRD